jgi:hypothetical protein
MKTKAKVGDRVLLHGVWGTKRVPCDDALCRKEHFNNWSVVEEADVQVLDGKGDPTGETNRQLVESYPRYHYEDLPREGRAGVVEAVEPGNRYAVRVGATSPTGSLEGTLSADSTDLEVQS